MTTSTLDAASLVDRLGLEPHPEGGHFREIYRSADRVLRGGDERSAATLIYFLLAAGDHSRWHVVASDEVWHYYEGDPLELIVFDPATSALDVVTLGPLDVAGVTRCHAIPAGHWQAARSKGSFSLVGCTVSPGFEFEDFRFVGELEDLEEPFEGPLRDYAYLL